ncbi:unnamed protein product, partial [Symbiodinium necroappetens]
RLRQVPRRHWKVHTLGKALLPRWRQSWRTGFQRAYRAVHSARGGLISDVPSLLWTARRFHCCYDRSFWPDIHAVLQSLIGTPGLETLRSALVPLETRCRRGRKVRKRGTPTPSAAAPDAYRRPDCSWYGPQLAHQSAYMPMLASAAWCSLRSAFSTCCARLAYRLMTRAHSTGPEQKLDAWRGGSPPRRLDPYQFQFAYTIGHRDGLTSTRKGHTPPQSLLYAWPAASLCENAWKEK